MIRPDPIVCPKCGTVVVSDSRNLTNYVMPPGGIRCVCGEQVVGGYIEVIC